MSDEGAPRERIVSSPYTARDGAVYERIVRDGRAWWSRGDGTFVGSIRVSLAGGRCEYIRPEPEFESRLQDGTSADESAMPKVHESGGSILTRHRFVTLEDTAEILVYDAALGIYVANGETLIAKEVRARLESVPDARSVAHLINEVTAWVRYTHVVTRKDFDADPKRVVVANGILNVETRELSPHTPDCLARVRIPVPYRPETTCPRIDEFSREIVKEEDVPVLYELAGYPLHAGYPIQVAPTLLGEGSNGKSTYLALVRVFLGAENVSAISLQDLAENRFAAAELYGKLANIASDIPSKKLASTGVFKGATGGDLLYAEHKFQKPFFFVNRAKFLFSCNKLPDTGDDSPAYYRRFVLLHFPNMFEGDAADPHLLEKLTTPDELSGLLNRALDAREGLLARGRFSGDTRTGAEKRDDYRRRADTVYAFVQDRMEEELVAEIGKKALYGAYVDYCHAVLKADPLLDVHFYRKLRSELGEAYAEERQRHGNGREKVLLGWKLKDAPVRVNVAQAVLP